MPLVGRGSRAVELSSAVQEPRPTKFSPCRRSVCMGQENLRTANPKNPLAPEDLSFIFLTPYIFMAMSDNIDLTAFRLHDKDTGSADVQVALLTRRINQLTDHLKVFRKDHSSRRGLLKLVATRRSLLDYLKRTQQDRYKSVIEKLNLRK